MAYTSTLLVPKDNTVTTINNVAGYAAGVTSIVVADGSVFPAVPFAVALGADTINYEEAVVTTVSTNTLTLLTATANAHAHGEPVEVTVGTEYFTRLNGFATGHTHTGSTDGAGLVLASLPVNPTCALLRTTAQSVTFNAFQNVTFATADATEVKDTEAMHDGATNTDRIVAKTAGLYIAFAIGQWTAAAGGIRQWGVIVSNGVGSANNINAADASNTVAMQAFAISQCAVNDYFTIRVFQNQTSGGALNLVASSVLFVVWRLGA